MSESELRLQYPWALGYAYFVRQSADDAAPIVVVYRLYIECVANVLYTITSRWLLRLTI